MVESSEEEEEMLVVPKRCSWCFTVQGVAIASICFVVGVAILTFILDFTVFEIHSSQEQKWKSKHELFQDGGLFEVDPHWPNYGDLKIIDLQNVKVNVSLLRVFMTGGYQVERIRLRNMKLFGKLAHMNSDSSSSYQYSLKEFVLDLNQPIGPLEDYQIDACDVCVIANVTSSIEPMSQFRCLRPLLFYINLLEEPSLAGNMEKANISITVYGRTLLRVVHELSGSMQLTSMFNDCNTLLSLWSQEYLSRLSKLSLSGCTNLTASTLRTILSYGNLTHLILNNVTLTGLNPGLPMSQIFQNAVSLKELIINAKPFNKARPDQIFTNQSRSREVTFCDFPSTLTSLVLSDVMIVRGNTPENLNLDTLRLSAVTFKDETTMVAFRSLVKAKNLAFRQVRIVIGNTDIVLLEDSSVWTLFFNMVMEHSTKIWFENPFYDSYKRGSGRSADEERQAWELWLRKKGMHYSILTGHDPAFVLTASESWGQRSWDIESSSHGSASSNDANAVIWFHFMRMGTFIRDDLWNQVDW